MPVITLEELKCRRKRAGITQEELAIRSGFSQSLIARIESEDVNPSLSTVNRIYDTIRNKQEESSVAKTIMTGRVISIGKNESVKKAIDMMRKNKISQLPVVEKNMVIGSITDKGLIAKLNREKDKEGFKGRKVVSVMEKAFPEVKEDADIASITELLEKHPTIIVKKNKRMVGMICSSDLFDLII